MDPDATACDGVTAGDFSCIPCTAISSPPVDGGDGHFPFIGIVVNWADSADDVIFCMGNVIPVVNPLE